MATISLLSHSTAATRAKLGRDSLIITHLPRIVNYKGDVVVIGVVQIVYIVQVVQVVCVVYLVSNSSSNSSIPNREK